MPRWNETNRQAATLDPEDPDEDSPLRMCGPFQHIFEVAFSNAKEGKAKSAIAHFNKFLQIHHRENPAKLTAQSLEYGDLTHDLFGKFALYLSGTDPGGAKKYLKADKAPLALGSAVGYFSALKVSIIIANGYRFISSKNANGY